MKFSDILVKKSDNGFIHFLRSTAASFTAFSLDFGVLVFLTEIAKLDYRISAAAGFISGTVLLYFLSVKWVFSRRRIKDSRLEFILFAGFSALGLLLNLGFLVFFTDVLNIDYRISRIMAACLVFFLNFAARKLILFSEKKKVTD